MASEKGFNILKIQILSRPDLIIDLKSRVRNREAVKDAPRFID